MAEHRSTSPSLRPYPYADFPGDKSIASWLLNAALATDWQAFQRDGMIKPSK